MDRSAPFHPSTELGRSASAVAPFPLEHLPEVVCGETLANGAGIVDLWLFFYEEHGTPELFDAYERLLPPDEQERRDRFHFTRDRRLFLATRALARTVLSSYAEVAPANWVFATGEQGKPYVAAPALGSQLAFNLSNTEGLIACAVSCAHRSVGVDAEVLAWDDEMVSLADHCFSPSEVRALNAQCASQQGARFFAYWTLKESYIKARGLGLALPLYRFSFLLDGRSDIGIAIDRELDDDGARWRFALVDVQPHYLVAVGVDTGGVPLSLRQRVAVPLRDIPPLTPSSGASPALARR